MCSDYSVQVQVSNAHNVGRTRTRCQARRFFSRRTNTTKTPPPFLTQASYSVAKVVLEYAHCSANARSSHLYSIGCLCCVESTIQFTDIHAPRARLEEVWHSILLALRRIQPVRIYGRSCTSYLTLRETTKPCLLVTCDISGPPIANCPIPRRPSTLPSCSEFSPINPQTRQGKRQKYLLPTKPRFGWFGRYPYSR